MDRFCLATLSMLHWVFGRFSVILLRPSGMFSIVGINTLQPLILKDYNDAEQYCGRSSLTFTNFTKTL